MKLSGSNVLADERSAFLTVLSLQCTFFSTLWGFFVAASGKAHACVMSLEIMQKFCKWQVEKPRDFSRA